MIVTSMLLVIVGAVTLVIGIFTDELNLVYISIGACLLAGLFLIVGIVRGRPSRKPVVTGGGEQASWSGAASSWKDGDDEALEREPAPRSGGVQVVSGSAPEETAADETFQPPADEDEIVVVPKRTAGTRKAAGKKAAKKAAGKKAAKRATKKAAGKRATKKAAGKRATKKAAGKKAAKKATSQAADAKRLEGALGDVSGLGPAKRKALLQHFGSYDALRNAKPSDLTEVPGVSETLAQRIRRALR